MVTGWWRLQQLEETFSVELVRYRGDADVQRPNLTSEKQPASHAREDDMPDSIAHVQYRGDTRRSRLVIAMQPQEREAADPVREVRHLKLYFPSREQLMSVVSHTAATACSV
jgi:hypothetical protein